MSVSTTCRRGANAAWLALNVIAHNLSRWTVHLGGLDIDATATTDAPASSNDPGVEDSHSRAKRKSFVTTDTLRSRYLAIPGRLARSARQLTLLTGASSPACSTRTTAPTR